jgi:hypothetical protein
MVSRGMNDCVNCYIAASIVMCQVSAGMILVNHLHSCVHFMVFVLCYVIQLCNVNQQHAHILPPARLLT